MIPDLPGSPTIFIQPSGVNVQGITSQELVSMKGGGMPNRAAWLEQFVDVPVGGAGLPFSSSMSAGYAQRPGTRLYATLQQVGEAIGPPNAWGRIWEREYTRLHELPHNQLLRSYVAGRIPGVLPPGG